MLISRGVVPDSKSSTFNSAPCGTEFTVSVIAFCVAESAATYTVRGVPDTMIDVRNFTVWLGPGLLTAIQASPILICFLSKTYSVKCGRRPRWRFPAERRRAHHHRDLKLTRKW